MISNFNLSEEYFMEKKWFQIGQILGGMFFFPKTPDFYDKFY
jgi:hypothetical protein